MNDSYVIKTNIFPLLPKEVKKVADVGGKRVGIIVFPLSVQLMDLKTSITLF